MTSTPTWFKVTACVALVWNLVGCIAFAMDLGMSQDDIAQLPEAQKALYAARPAWALMATAIAVFGGLFGCLGLLLRRKWALALLVLSLLGVLVQDFGLFVLVDGARLAGQVVVALQALVLAIAIGLVMLARNGIARGWLH